MAEHKRCELQTYTELAPHSSHDIDKQGIMSQRGMNVVLTYRKSQLATFAFSYKMWFSTLLKDISS